MHFLINDLCDQFLKNVLDMEEINISIESVKASEMVRETFRFWFHDQEHIRSPFPSVIHEAVFNEATRVFHNWLVELPQNTTKEIDSMEARDKLESIIFETALKLVKTEDEKITIYFPFLPRIGDIVEPGVLSGIYIHEKSHVIARELVTEKDLKFLKVDVKGFKSGNIFSTRFELPA
jgi:hypothetical protein